MTEQYTPTTEEVRDSYRFSNKRPDICGKDFGAEFDRWLAERDRQVAERAYREGRIDEHHDRKRYVEYEEGKLTADQFNNTLRSPNPYRKAVQT